MAQDNAELTRSMEDYLEAIYNLKARSDVARVKDIAHEMDVKMPSVTGALHALAQKGLVKHDPYDTVELTEEGLDRARSVADRHSAVKRFLVEVLGLVEEDAEAEACGIEHAIKPETLEKLLRFVNRARSLEHTSPAQCHFERSEKSAFPEAGQKADFSHRSK